MMKSRVIQEYEENIEKLTEEIKELRETANEKIKQLEQEKQTLDKAAKYSAKQLAVEKVSYFYFTIYQYKDSTPFPFFTRCFCSSIVSYLTVYYFQRSNIRSMLQKLEQIKRLLKGRKTQRRKGLRNWRVI